MVRMRACPKHASERSLYCTGLSKGLSCAGWLRHPGARPSARSQRRAIPAPGCARKPGGRTPVLSARRVPRLTSRLARQLAFLRKPMAAHGVPLLKRGVDGASCTAPPSAMFAATMRPAKPRTGDGAPRKVQRVRLQRKARRVPRRNGWELETGNLKLGTGGANSRTHALTNSRTSLASAAGACGRWDAPFPRGVEAPLRAHGFRSAVRTDRSTRFATPETDRVRGGGSQKSDRGRIPFLCLTPTAPRV